MAAAGLAIAPKRKEALGFQNRAAPNIVDRSGPKPHVDLRRMLRAELHAQGLAHGAIDDVWGCTVLEPARFFSFRRDGKASGRHLSAIVPML